MPPVTEPVEQTTERPTEQATERPTEQATEAVTTETPTVATTPEAAEETTTQAAEAGEVTTAEPTESTTETPTEAAPETTARPTEPPAPTEPKAVEASTKMIDPLTRPTSVHKFFKQSAFVSSTKDERTCDDVNGTCRAESCLSTEYFKGRFQCGAGFVGCCVPR